MAPLKVKKVVSFSSEDPLFPASNLVSKGKWKCKDEGEKQAWVLFQLEETSTISNIDIGNNGAAFIEVQVGRLGTEPDKMKVLLVASSFMSVNEARVGDNMGRVRMFGQDKLAQEIAKERWDLVKVVLTQPFTKQFKYGLSFIALSGPGNLAKEESKKESGSVENSSRLGAFKLKAEPKQDIEVGTYFARRNLEPSQPKDAVASSSVAASLRADTTVAELERRKESKIIEQSKRKRELELTPAMKEEVKKRKIGRGSALPSRNSLPGETSETEETDSSKEVKRKRVEHDSSKKETAPKTPKNGKDKRHDQQKKDDKHTRKHAAIRRAPFCELFKGVVFTISGFQNPLRGDIRQKALDMGAKYCGDWNSSCTHLVCAFANTPKFNQVKGKGIIVKKEWIEECHSQRKRLPWRRFCLDRKDEGKDESEEEIWEEENIGVDADLDTDEEIEQIRRAEMDEKSIKASSVSQYECDTDEEIEKIKASESESKASCSETRNNSNNLLNNKSSEPNNGTVEINSYDCDTDEEPSPDLPEPDEDPYEVDTDIDEEERTRYLPNTENISIGQLPDFFCSCYFYLHGDFKPGERKLLERYITACGGKVVPYMEANVKIVITYSKWSKAFDDALDVSKSVEFVNPRWIFKCKDVGMKVEFGNCKIERN